MGNFWCNLSSARNTISRAVLNMQSTTQQFNISRTQKVGNIDINAFGSVHLKSCSKTFPSMSHDRICQTNLEFQFLSFRAASSL